MIFVNLLPQELRLKESRKKISIPYRPIAIGVFLIFLMFALYNLFIYIRVREEYRGLEKQWKAMAERNTQAELLERELGTAILSEVDFYDALVDPSLETARVLNLISDLIPKSMWFTNLKFERNGKDIELILNGLSEAMGRSSKLVDIQNFANELKEQMEQLIGPVSPANPNVKKHIKVTVTTSSQPAEIGKSEITQFTATFKTGEATQK